MKRNLKAILPASAFAGALVLAIGCGGGGSGVSTTGGTTGGGTQPTQRYNTITVVVTRIEAESTFDVILVDQADFKATISVDGNSRSFGPIDNEDVINPNWSHSRSVAGKNSIAASIQAFDEDTGLLQGDDDRVDFDPSSTGVDVNITVNTFTGAISGDVTGMVGDTFTLTGAGNSGADMGTGTITFRVLGS